jgi:hypothetical protein
MNDKVYILLDIVDGNTERVVQVMRETPGVVSVEELEGPPDVILVMEASERQQLAKVTIQALALVGTMAERIQLLPINKIASSPAIAG